MHFKSTLLGLSAIRLRSTCLGGHLAPSKEPLSSRNLPNTLRQTFVLAGFDGIFTAPAQSALEPVAVGAAAQSVTDGRHQFVGRSPFRLC
jgi:hypothetical protein